MSLVGKILSLGRDYVAFPTVASIPGHLQPKVFSSIPGAVKNEDDYQIKFVYSEGALKQQLPESEFAYNAAVRHSAYGGLLEAIAGTIAFWAEVGYVGVTG